MADKGSTMVRCRDVGLDCDGVIRAETEGEVLRKAVQHLESEHQDAKITPEILDRIRAQIREAQN